MNDKKTRGLVIITAAILLLAGCILYITFDKQGINKNKNNNYINYNINDYIEINPIVFNNYNDVYNSIDVSKVNIKNVNKELTDNFIKKEDEIISYITGYYKEITANTNYLAVNNVYSTIKTQINEAVLSVYYQVDFNLDENIFEDNIKSYIATVNIDLGTNKVLTKDDLLLKYNYTKNSIADKLFNEDILIDKGQVAIDKNTNISVTRSDIERKKDEYIDRIISEFNNIIDMYIENNTLVLVYDTKELKSIFFDNKFNTDIKFRYLK